MYNLFNSDNFRYFSFTYFYFGKACFGCAKDAK